MAFKTTNLFLATAHTKGKEGSFAGLLAALKGHYVVV
jgi:hypothetical protein